MRLVIATSDGHLGCVDIDSVLANVGVGLDGSLQPLVEAYIPRGDPDAPPEAVVLVPGSSLIATTARGSSSIWVYSMEAMAPVKRLDAHAGPVTALGVAQGPLRLVSADAEGRLLVWDASTFALLTQVDESPADYAAPLPDNDTADPPATIPTPNLPHALRHRVAPIAGGIACLCVSSSGEHTLFAIGHGFALVDNASAVLVAVAHAAHAAPIATLGFILGESQAYTVDVAGIAKTWRLPSRPYPPPQTGPPTPPFTPLPLASLYALDSDLVTSLRLSDTALLLSDGSRTLIWEDTTRSHLHRCTAASLALTLTLSEPPPSSSASASAPASAPASASAAAAAAAAAAVSAAGEEEES